MATEEERAAAAIRDHIVPLIEAKGHAQAVGPTKQMMWEAGSFRFAPRKPSSPGPLRRLAQLFRSLGVERCQRDKEFCCKVCNGL